MEYELPELGEGVCEPAGIFEPCAGADVVRDGEAGGSKVLKSGECPRLPLNELVLIMFVPMGSIEEGGAQVWPTGRIIIGPWNSANSSSEYRVGV